MEKHEFSFITLRDYLKVNNPEVVIDITISHTLTVWDICIGIINLYYLSEDNTGLSLLIRNSKFALNMSFLHIWKTIDHILLD